VSAATRPRVVVIAHHDAPLHTDAIPRWVLTWGELAGIVVLREQRSSLWKRLRRERRRVGTWRLADVFAFRALYRLTRASRDAAWKAGLLQRLQRELPPLPADVPRCESHTPNAGHVQAFLQQCRPNFTLALCKHIIAERVFSIPTHGTYVLHPGVCPEYRNAHGCFWALANDDLERVGLTLLRIDRGIDTGPVYGYFSTDFDEASDSHIVIQHRVLFDNLAQIAAKLLDIWRGSAAPIATAGRASREYGQPWLSAWWRWQRAAERRRTAATRAPGHAL
jgi:hypothetical protein